MIDISAALTHGPAWLSVAPKGTTLPVLSDAPALVAGTFPGFNLVGRTATPVVRKYAPEYRQVKSTQAGRTEANLVIGEDISFETTLLQVTADRLQEATASTVTTSGGLVPASKTGFNATATYTVGGSDTFTINVNSVGAKTITLSAGTYNAAQLATHLQAAIRAGMVAGGTYTAAQANAVTVETLAVGGGFAIIVKAALEAGQTFTLTDGTGTPLAELSLTGPVVPASSSGPSSKILRPRGVGKAPEYALAVVGPFAGSTSLTVAERVSVTSPVELSDGREEETKLPITWTVLEGDYAIYVPAA